MSIPTTYRGSITREQWLIDETRIVARLMLDDGIESESELTAHVLSNNPFQYPTEREVKSIARACARRINAVSNGPSVRSHILNLIAHGTSDQLKQANLYAMMCDNRIVWEFMTNLIAPKFQALDTALAKHEIAAFLEGLRTQNEHVATWSPATLNKIRQVLSMCLEQCGMYNRKTEELNPPLLDYDLEQIIRANSDEAALSAFGVSQ